MDKSFLVLFFKKEQALLFEKRSKNFLSISLPVTTSLTLGGALPKGWAMDKPPTSRPTLKDRALAEKTAREAREAAALRANLLRRKAQARSRAPPPPEQAPADGGKGFDRQS